MPAELRIGWPRWPAQRRYGTVAMALLAAVWATCAPAQPVACEDERLLVAAPDAASHAMLCNAATEIITRLEDCHLHQTQPLTIEMVDDIAHPLAVCLAAYDCDFDRVRIVGRQDYSDLVGPGDPYADFPPAVLVRTLLSHELTHALLQHTAGGTDVPLIDHEYTAAAMELELMEPQWRDLILGHAGLDGPSESRIDIWIYRLEPRRFAANAWLHFSAPGNGCDLVSRLVRGDFSFDSEAK